MTDTSRSFVYINFDVVKDSSTTLIANNNVAPCNLFVPSLFEHFALYFNNELVSSTNLYHYESYIKSLLTYPSEYKNNELCSSIYYPDSNPSSITSNDSFTKRKELISGSKKVEGISIIYDDVWNSGKALPSSTDIRLKFKRSGDSFALISPDTATYKIRLHQCILYAYKLRVNESISLMNEKFF